MDAYLTNTLRLRLAWFELANDGCHTLMMYYYYVRYVLRSALGLWVIAVVPHTLVSDTCPIPPPQPSHLYEDLVGAHHERVNQKTKA